MELEKEVEMEMEIVMGGVEVAVGRLETGSWEERQMGMKMGVD